MFRNFERDFRLRKRERPQPRVLRDVHPQPELDVLLSVRDLHVGVRVGELLGAEHDMGARLIHETRDPIRQCLPILQQRRSFLVVPRRQLAHQLVLDLAQHVLGVVGQGQEPRGGHRRVCRQFLQIGQIVVQLGQMRRAGKRGTRDGGLPVLVLIEFLCEEGAVLDDRGEKAHKGLALVQQSVRLLCALLRLAGLAGGLLGLLTSALLFKLLRGGGGGVENGRKRVQRRRGYRDDRTKSEG